MLQYINSKQFIDDYKKYLESNGISSAHIARKLNVSPQNLQNLYKKQQLTIDDVVDLCNAIGYKCSINIDRALND